MQCSVHLRFRIVLYVINIPLGGDTSQADIFSDTSDLTARFFESDLVMSIRYSGNVNTFCTHSMLECTLQ